MLMEGMGFKFLVTTDSLKSFIEGIKEQLDSLVELP